jgi:hypothetical protein
MKVIRPVTLDPTGSFSRSSTKTCIGSDGLLQTVPVDVPAWQYDASNLSAAPTPLLELAATNLIPNSTGAGAVVGTPGTLPTYQGTYTNTTGMTLSVAGVGTEAGIQYVDYRLSGTPAAGGTVFDLQLAAYPGTVINSNTTVTQSVSCSLVAGTINGITSLDCGLVEFSSTNVNLVARVIAAVSLSSGPLSGKVLNGSPLTTGTTAYGIPYLRFTLTGVAVDVTFRVGLAQLEVGASRTSYIPTSGSQVTRAADIITGSGVIWSSAVEAAPALYAGGTTYAAGDMRSVAGAQGLMSVYRSKLAANIGHTPASSPTWWEPMGNTYQTYSAAVTYAAGDAVIDLITHRVYVSVVSANIGNALTNPLKWYDDQIDTGDGANATNRWGMFDSIVGTSTATPGPLLMLVVAGAIDSLAMDNVDGSSIAITMTDAANMATVYSQKTDLTNDATIADYDAYFFDDVVTVSSLYASGIPPYYSGVIGIALIGPAPAIGVAVLGKSFDLGGSQYGAKYGFLSYAKKVVTPAGNTRAKKGAISKRMDVTTMIDNANFDRTNSVMAELDGVPTMFIGADGFSSLIQFGLVKDFGSVISYPTNSLCNFSIEGFI